MYYKVFTNNGEFYIGYLFNIKDKEQIRKYLLWELKNNLDDGNIDQEEYSEKKVSIMNISKDELTSNLSDYDLFISSSSEPFSESELDETQLGLIGTTPW